MCKLATDSDVCECGAPTVECDKLYEIKVSKECMECNSSIVTRMHLGSPDILDEPRFVFQKCPICKKYTMHALKMNSCKEFIKPEDFMSKKFREELRKG